MWHFLLHFMGLDTSNSRWYLFWSAFGSGPLAWCFIPLGYYLHHLCHEHKCYRIGHPDAHGKVRCHKHIKKGI